MASYELQEAILPDDEYNRILIQNVHPPDWVNPQPAERYNLVVIGAGTAGLVTAAIGAALGAKVALIERHLMGGDCLNVGCVPSKGILRASRAWAAIKNAGEFGVKIPTVQYDFGAAMSRMRRLRAKISHTDSADRFQKLGVDVFIGEGRFTTPETVEVRGKTLGSVTPGSVTPGSVTLRFAKAVICTGARPAAPPIVGLMEAGFLTNETLFTLTELPRRLAVIGAGPIGCEMAQCLARFGSDVSLFEQTAHILPREDADAAEIVQKQMRKDGVSLVFNSNVTGVERQGQGKVIHYEIAGDKKEQVVDEILVGVGRAPNVEGLGLEMAGVEYESRKGIKVNNRLQTTHPRIFAAGDICFPFKFTHTADALAQIVIQNALFPHPLGLGYATTDAMVIPWCTYTEPEIAHVGMTEAEAVAKGMTVATFTYPLNEVDRAILDGEGEGFARIHVKEGSDTILGATLVAAHAGEMISEITLAMKSGIGHTAITGTIHPYPTEAEVIKKTANLWRKTTLTETKKRLLTRLFTWMR